MLVGKVIVAYIEKWPVDEVVKKLHAEYGLSGFLIEGLAANAEEIRSGLEELRAISAKTNDQHFFSAFDRESCVLSPPPSPMTHHPSNLAIAATRNPRFAYIASRQIGLEMRAIGLNVLIAPLADVPSPRNISAVETFGDELDLVKQMSVRFIDGLATGGVFCWVKHFPRRLVVPKPSATPLDHEVLDLLFANRVGGLLVDEGGTVDFDTPKGTSARRVNLHGLKDRLGPSCMLLMQVTNETARARGLDVGEYAIASLDGGADMILIKERPSVVVDVVGRICDYAMEKETFYRKLNDTVYAMRNFKQKFFGTYRGVSSQVMGCRAHQRNAEAIADSSVTVIASNAELPIPPNSEVAIIFPSTILRVIDPMEEIPKHAKRFSGVPYVRCDDEELGRALRAIRKTDAFVLFVPALNGATALNPFVQNCFSEGTRGVLVVMGPPWGLEKMGWKSASIMLTYSASSHSIRAAMKAIFGEISAKGHLPVVLP